MSYGNYKDKDGNQLEINSPVKKSDIGISDNWTLVDAGMDTDKEGNSVATRGQITFRRDDGREFKHRILESNQDWSLEITERQILHIADKVMDKDAFIKGTQNCADFETYITKIAALLVKNAKDKKFRLKIVLNKKNFKIFPNYGNFMESMNVETTSLYIGKNDKIVATQVTPSSPSDRVESKTSNDDLPF